MRYSHKLRLLLGDCAESLLFKVCFARYHPFASDGALERKQVLGFHSCVRFCCSPFFRVGPHIACFGFFGRYLRVGIVFKDQLPTA